MSKSIMHLVSVLLLVCLYICECECLLQNSIHVSEVCCVRECRSIQSGASGLPYYCAPLVCVSDVMELLAVWGHNKPKTKKLGLGGLVKVW